MLTALRIKLESEDFVYSVIYLLTPLSTAYIIQTR